MSAVIPFLTAALISYTEPTSRQHLQRSHTGVFLTPAITEPIRFSVTEYLRVQGGGMEVSTAPNRGRENRKTATKPFSSATAVLEEGSGSDPRSYL